MHALAMGGYGAYVWAAFGFTLISMVGLLWQSWRAQQRRAEELATLRSTVRSGQRDRTGAGAPGAGRRLVATRPGVTDRAAADRPAAGSDSPTPGLIAPRTSEGT